MVQGAAFRILYLFIDTDTLNFAELCKRAGYGTDLGGYYLRQLVSDGLLQKEERGQYHITMAGKRALAESNNGRHVVMPRPRPAVILIVRQGSKVAVLKRTIQPFIGVVEWPAYSIPKGEPLAKAAAHALSLRLGLKGQPTLVGFFRRIDIFGADVFDDKIFAVHTFEAPESAVTGTVSSTGKTELIEVHELQTFERPARSLLDIFAYVQDKHREPYIEQRYELSEADLAAAS